MNATSNFTLPTSQHVIRAMIIEIGLGMVMWTTIMIVKLFVPGWDSNWLLIVCLLAGLEGLISPWLAHVRNLRGGEVSSFRIAEALAILLAIRVIALVLSGQLAALPDSFIAPDGPTIVALILGGITWMLSVGIAINLADLDEPPIIPPPVDATYISPVQKITARFYTGGVLLLIASGVLAIHNANVLILSVALALYFLPGLMLLSRLNFEISNKEWLQRRVKVSEALGRPWVRFGIGLIALAAVAAIIMPPSAAVGLADALLLALAAFWTWCRSLFATPPPPSIQPTPLPLNLPPPPQMPFATQPGAASGGIDLSGLGTLLTWVILVVIVVYIIRTYLRDYPNLFAFVRRFKVFAALRALWLALRNEARSAARNIRDYLPSLPSLPIFRFRRGRGTPTRYVHLSAQTPRDQIYYYYLSTLHRAAEQGIPRRESQTPYEYESVLELPAAQEAFDALTRAFVAARYATSPIDAEQAQRAREHWREVRQVLQQIKREREKPSSPAL